MENGGNKKYESVYSTKVRAGKRRTYFFDVRQTKGEDYFVTLTESTRKFEDNGYERHKIFLYKEDFNRFINGLSDAINHIKTELMPDYDYEQFERRQAEWEAQKALEAAEEAKNEGNDDSTTETESTATEENTTEEPATEEPVTEEPASEETTQDDSSDKTSEKSEEESGSEDEEMSW